MYTLAILAAYLTFGHGFYSNKHCVHDDFFGDDVWKVRSCLWTNICFSKSKQQWIYYAEDNTTSSEMRVSLGSLYANISSGEVIGFPFSPTVVQGPAPAAAVPLPPGLVVVNMLTFLDFNIGHFILDTVLPVFNILNLFGYAPRILDGVVKTEIVELSVRGIKGCAMIKAMAESQRSRTLTKLWARCRDTRKKFTFFMSDSPITFSPNWRTADEGDLICPRTVLSGMGHLTAHCENPSFFGRIRIPSLCNVNKGALYWQFRSFLMRRAKVDPDIQPAEPSIMLALRDSTLRSVSNVDEVVRTLKGDPFISQHKFSSVTLAGISIKGQLETLRSTTVLVSLCGGSAVFSSLFLPRWSSHIILCPGNISLDYYATSHFPYTRTFMLHTPSRAKGLRQADSPTTVEPPIMREVLRLVRGSLEFFGERRGAEAT